MVRVTSVILGIGLVILWLAGLSSSAVPGWLCWLDLVAAIGAFVVAGIAAPEAPLRERATGPAVESLGLFALWIIALATVGNIAMAWWNFGFAVAFGLVALFSGQDRATTRTIETPFRRSA